MQAAVSGHKKIAEVQLGNRRIVACLSETPDDLKWDKFLQSTPLGQYQQSNTWARAKATEGWKTARVVLTAGDEVVGGFQVLYKSWWWGGIGYVSKGPVVRHESGELAQFAMDLIRMVCARLRLSALVIQPPDSSDDSEFRLTDRGLINYAAGKVIESTWLVGLGLERDCRQKQMTTNTRREVRQAIRRGIRVREGKREDLPVFFDLMRLSCRRQRTKPNPSDVAFLYRLWDAASPRHRTRLFLAEHDGVPLGGLLCISFGNVVSAWKKGWSDRQSQARPNELLNYECIKWAAANGFDSVDFGAFDDEMAVAVLRGDPISERCKASRHFFNMRFGGRPVILPAAMIYIPNPLLRLAYRIVFSRKIRKAVERRKVMDAMRREALGRAEAKV